MWRYVRLKILTFIIYMSQKIFLDLTLDNESYSSHGNNNDLVNIESIEDNIEIW